jgi:hypothetical protein
VKKSPMPDLDMVANLAPLIDACVKNTVFLDARLLPYCDCPIISPDSGARANEALLTNSNVTQHLCVIVHIRGGRDPRRPPFKFVYAHLAHRRERVPRDSQMLFNVSYAEGLGTSTVASKACSKKS